MSTTPAPQPRPTDPFINSPDPLIDEVREARRWLQEKHGNDLRKHVEALRKIQQEWGGQIISDRGDRGTPSKRAV